MEKENIKVYNLTVVELESRELTAGEAEIVLNDVFVNSIANITKNVMEKLKSMCNEVKFGLRTNEDNTVYRVAIKVGYEEIQLQKLALIKDLIGSLVSITTRYISSCDAYKKELNDMLNEYSENETNESDSQFEETKEE